ncbi:MAG: YfjI family protein [Geminicoccaceae bacterium]
MSSNDLEAFLHGYRPDGHTTFIGIVPDGTTVAATFNGADTAEAAKWITTQNKARGIYFTANPTPTGLRKKPTKADIIRIEAVWADIDPQDGTRGEWLAERERLLTLADELAALSRPPTFIVDSGNGIQPIWMLGEPVEATPEYREAAEQLCGRIERALGAQGTHNVDRLLRCPGTANFPNAKKRQQGRTETQARLLHDSNTRYTWHALENLAAALETEPPQHARPIKRQRDTGGTGAADLELPEEPPEPLDAGRLRELQAKYPAAFDLARLDNDESRRDMALVALARRLGKRPAAAWRLIISVRTDNKRFRRDYIERTIARAYAEDNNDDDTDFAPDDPQPSWPEPEPLVAEHEKPAPYPIDALPPIIRNAVLSYQAFGQQPVELVACSALAAAALAIQGLGDVDRDGGNLVGPCSLSFVIVAKSGERKSACDKRMRRALTGWGRETLDEQAPLLKAARRRHAAWQAKCEAMLGRIKRIAYSTKSDHEIEVQQLESKLLALEQEEPDVPPEVALFHEETSPEQLAIILAKGWPSASLWSDEAGLVIGSHAMTKDVAMRFLSLLNRLWDGGDFKRERVTRESVHLRSRRFTCSLMMQPHVLDTLTTVGDGVARNVGALARYLIAWPESTMGARPYAEGDLNSPALAAYDARLRALLDLPLPLKDGALEPPKLRLSGDAFAFWREFHDDVERELGRRGEFGDVSDFGAKVAEQAARLACVMHVVEHGPTGEIGAAEMLAGAKVGLWHLHEARRVLPRLARYSEIDDAQLLLDWLQDLDAPPALGDVLRLGPYRLRNKETRDAAVTVLAEHNLARVEQRGNNARSLALNPALREPK